MYRHRFLYRKSNSFIVVTVHYFDSISTKLFVNLIYLLCTLLCTSRSATLGSIINYKVIFVGGKFASATIAYFFFCFCS